ncbi:hypothetical protein [Paraburkholderia kirstenboschensis]|uniref:Uncharacterized protein n=1 Tax=Paraburkholderia kirstenboschensis TaxID=1245436 RepID=A0ABZ0EC05_9BURK|nr:hypothetical protein [Paraburkholderia kirstenboschensis]WOD14475.1 hypothetical protein RW095_03135 [Paraburkholderia kirstenboschensis]
MIVLDLSRISMHCSEAALKLLDFSVWRAKGRSIGKAIEHANYVRGT